MQELLASKKIVRVRILYLPLSFLLHLTSGLGSSLRIKLRVIALKTAFAEKLPRNCIINSTFPDASSSRGDAGKAGTPGRNPARKRGEREENKLKTFKG